MFRIALLLLLALGLTQQASAQAGPHRTGLGVVLGNPTSLTFKTYPTAPVFGSEALDVSAAWDFNDEFVFAQVHFLWENPLPTEPQFRTFYGPGVFLGSTNTDEVALGASFNAGLALWTGRFEFFLQGTPRLSVIPATEFDLGAGLGARFYF